MPLQWKQHSVTGKSRGACEVNRFEGVIFVNPNRKTQHKSSFAQNTGVVWMLDHVFARSQRQIHGPNKFPIWWCVLMFAQLKQMHQMPRVQIQSGVDSQSVVSISNEDAFLHLMTFVQPVFLNCCSIFPKNNLFIQFPTNTFCLWRVTCTTMAKSCQKLRNPGLQPKRNIVWQNIAMENAGFMMLNFHQFSFLKATKLRWFVLCLCVCVMLNLWLHHPAFRALRFSSRCRPFIQMWSAKATCLRVEPNVFLNRTLCFAKKQGGNN